MGFLWWKSHEEYWNRRIYEIYNYCERDRGLIMPFYRQSNGPGAGGAGVSEAGSKGAAALFGGAATAFEGGSLPFFAGADNSASAKALVDVYVQGVSAPGTLCPQDAAPKQILEGLPDLEFGSAGGAPAAGTDLHLSDPAFADLGKAVNEIVAGMADVLNQMSSSPMGFLSSVLNFLFQLFSQIARSITEILSEIARAAAAAVEDALKKQLEQAAQNTQTLQPLELFNQTASTQTQGLALKSPAST